MDVVAFLAFFYFQVPLAPPLWPVLPRGGAWNLPRYANTGPAFWPLQPSSPLPLPFPAGPFVGLRGVSCVARGRRFVPCGVAVTVSCAGFKNVTQTVTVKELAVSWLEVVLDEEEGRNGNPATQQRGNASAGAAVEVKCAPDNKGPQTTPARSSTEARENRAERHGPTTAEGIRAAFAWAPRANIQGHHGSTI